VKLEPSRRDEEIRRQQRVVYRNTRAPEMDNLHSTFFTAAARIKIQKNMSGSSLKPLEAR
jgi:hypothetical protein